MKIDKAIEILAEVNNDYADQLWDDALDAISLGIEALKRVKESRKKAYFTTRSLLPGETRD